MNWLNKKKYIIILFFLFVWVYSIIHAYINHITAIILGYVGTIRWDFIFPALDLMKFPDIGFADIFAVTIAPYLISIILLILLVIFRKNIKHAAYIAVFPFTDTVLNAILGLIFYFIGIQSDFSNILLIGGLSNSTMFFLPFIIILAVSIYLMKFFYKDIFKVLKK